MQCIPKRDRGVATPIKICNRKCFAAALRHFLCVFDGIRAVLSRNALGAAIQQLDVGRFDPVFRDVAVAVVDAHAVADIQKRCIGDLSRAHAHGEGALAVKAQEVDAVAIYDRRADLGDRALDALIIVRRDVDGALIVGDEVIFEQHLTVVRLAVGDRRAGGDDLMFSSSGNVAL